MTLALILYLLTGILLGHRFKILILVPVVVLALPLASAEGVALGSRFGPAELIAAAALSLQIGYFLGACIRCFLIGDLASQSRTSSLERPAPTQ
jgi:hypothetical protein